MSDDVTSLWSSEIRPEIQSPVSILRTQARALQRQTGGVLTGDIGSKVMDENKVVLSFDIVVPALEQYRQRILNVGHTKDLPYPCIIDAELFRGDNNAYTNFLESGQVYTGVRNAAKNDAEFLDIIGNVLRSSHVVSVAQSLIARTTDAGEENS